MSSCTIHVIGFSADEIKGDKLQRSEVYAMNKMEMAQKKRIMEKEGYWDKWQSWQLEKLMDDFSIMGEVHHDA